MSRYEIESPDHDESGKHYALPDSAPIDGITVDELDEIVVVHRDGDVHGIEETLLDLVAIERDRLLGYHTDELHVCPEIAIQQALEALTARGYLIQRESPALPVRDERSDTLLSEPRSEQGGRESRTLG